MARILPPFYVSIPAELQPQAEVLAQACSEVLQPRSCAVTSELRGPAKIEQLSDDGFELSVCVEERCERDTLGFAKEDEPEERARALGLAVGILAHRQAEHTEAAPPAVRRAPPSQGDTATLASPARPAPSLEVGAQTLAGNALEDAVRFGVQVDATAGWSPIPVQALAAGRAEMMPAANGLTSSWLALGLGVRIPIPLASNLEAEVGAAIWAESWRVSATATATADEDAERRGYFSAEGSAGVRYRAGDWSIASAISLRTTPGQPLRVGGEPRNGNPALLWAGRLGLAFRFF